MPGVVDASKGQVETGKSDGLGRLLHVPEAVQRSAGLIAGLDRCLLVGFGRLAVEQNQALDALNRVMAGTPLGDELSKALAALRANEFQPRHFAVLAAARAAIQGARYDALLAQAREALGRTVDDEAPVPKTDGNGDDQATVLCESARHWLMELAITGFKQLDAASLAPFSATLENLQERVELGRLASLLTGFQEELLAALPIGHGSAIPVYRWADLWSAGMVSSLQAERGTYTPKVIGKVSGTFSVLGVDLRQHGSFVSAVVYGLFATEREPARIVRVTLSSYKVDALQGRELWRCFAGGKSNLPLLRAIGGHVPLKLTDMTLLASGDLLWDGSASEAGTRPVDVFVLAGRCLAAGGQMRFPTVPPAERHPVQLAELIVLADKTPLPIAVDRLGGTTELTPEDVKAADAVIGLLRFDGGRWMVQPLAVMPGATREKKAFASAYVGSDAYEVATKKPKKGEPNTLAVLRERAGRLLRKKA